jgi:AGZA family xanthine/uracil permease-like MFS transporter
MASPTKYPWFTKGDLNAFFGLMLDNVANLVVLTGILTMVFDFPADFIFTHMIPGTALGVLVGDLVYTWMAFRLSRRTGRTDITAMPLGLDTPSTIGVAFAVLGPVYMVSHDPMVTWQVGMATMMFMGVIKLALSFAGDWIRRVVPQAGLLGSLAGIGIALLGVLPLMKLFDFPVVGMVAFGLVLYTLVARIPLPGQLGKLPGAAAAVVLGTILYYGLGQAGLLGEGYHLPEFTFAFTPPVPTLGFVDGLGRALDFLPVAIPFGLLTIVGGINVTESARVAGDDYSTRNILLTEAIATLVAGITGGVAQSTPYIGHPAYKAMGGRAGYTLACGLFIGIGGAFGFVSSLAAAIPEAAVVPILIFIGIEIVSQTFEVCPRRHYPAVALSFLPIVAYLVLIQWKSLLGSDLSALPPHQAGQYPVVAALGNGFILTAMLWGAFGAHLIDRKLVKASVFLLVCAIFSLVGMIHSVNPDGNLYLPWNLETALPFRIGAGYAAIALILLPGILAGKHLGKEERGE